MQIRQIFAENNIILTLYKVYESVESDIGYALASLTLTYVPYVCGHFVGVLLCG